MLRQVALLRILAGVEPGEGVVTLRSGRVGFLEQEPELDGALSAREVVRQGLAGREEILAELAAVHEQLGSAGDEAMERLLAASSGWSSAWRTPAGTTWSTVSRRP